MDVSKKKGVIHYLWKFPVNFPQENILPALLQKLVGEFCFGGGKFGGNLVGIFQTHKLKAQKFGGGRGVNFGADVPPRPQRPSRSVLLPSQCFATVVVFCYHRVHAKGVVLCERACFCLLSAFYDTPPSKNPSKNLCLCWSPYKAPSKNPSKKHLLVENLLRTLLRSVWLHDPLGVRPIPPSWIITMTMVFLAWQVSMGKQFRDSFEAPMAPSRILASQR